MSAFAVPGLVERLEEISALRPRFEGLTALVTGGGNGIGEAVAVRLAAEGAHVVVVDVDAEGARRVAAQVGGTALPGSAGDAQHMRDVVAATLERHGRLDVVVACPGSGIGSAPLLETTPEGWQAAVHVNLMTAVNTVRAALGALTVRGGSVVVISSVGGLSSAPGNTAYQTVKAGLLAFVRALAADHGPQGVRANAVCPGWTMTPGAIGTVESFAAAMGITGQAAYDQAQSVVPLRRAAQPAELAAVCAFLASSDASYVTGATVVADGGTMAISPVAAASPPPG